MGLPLRPGKDNRRRNGYTGAPAKNALHFEDDLLCDERGCKLQRMSSVGEIEIKVRVTISWIAAARETVPSACWEFKGAGGVSNNHNCKGFLYNILLRE
jgi:hypothetical protein